MIGGAIDSGRHYVPQKAYGFGDQRLSQLPGRSPPQDNLNPKKRVRDGQNDVFGGDSNVIGGSSGSSSENVPRKAYDFGVGNFSFGLSHSPARDHLNPKNRVTKTGTSGESTFFPNITSP